MTQFISSNRTNPCPVCSRVEDSDCTWAEDLKTVLCHTKANPNSKVPQPPDEIDGYKFTGNINDRGYCSRAVYVLAADNQPFTKVSRPPSNEIKHYYYPTANGQNLCRVNRKDLGGGNKQIWQEYWITDNQLARHRSEGCWVSVSDNKVKQQKATQAERDLYLELVEPLQAQIHLYRIGEQINQRAINSGQPLYVVEGESVVDLLIDLGIPATTSIGGAGKWHLYGAGNYKADLAEATQSKLVICPDRDPPGIKHGKTIAADFPGAQWLYASPGDKEWNSPSDGYDLGDWVEHMQHHGVGKHEICNQLVGAISRARSFDSSTPDKTTSGNRAMATETNGEPSYQEFLKKVESLLQYEDADEYKFHRTKLARTFGYRVEDIDDLIRRKLMPEEKKEQRIYDLHDLRDKQEFALAWLVPGLLPRGESLLFSAEAKMGKTLLSDDLIFHLTTGEDDFLGIGALPKTGRVLKISVDESLQSTVQKAEKRYGPAWMEAGRVRLVTDWKITEFDFLESQINEYQPDLVVIDSLRQVASNLGISENSAEFVDAIASVIKLCRKKNTSLVVIHHDNKNKESNGIDRARGSSSLPAAFWGILRLDPFPIVVEEGEGKQKKKVTKFDPQDTRRLLNLTARDVAPQRLLLELELENHHWINHGEYGDEDAGATKDLEERVINLLRVNPQPLSTGDLLILMEIDFSQKRSLYRAVEKLVQARRINKVKSESSPSRGRPTWCYSLPTQETCSNVSVPNTPPPSLGPSEVELSQNTQTEQNDRKMVSDVDTEFNQGFNDKSVLFNDSSIPKNPQMVSDVDTESRFNDNSTSSGLREGATNNLCKSGQPPFEGSVTPNNRDGLRGCPDLHKDSLGGVDIGKNDLPEDEERI